MEIQVNITCKDNQEAKGIAEAQALIDVLVQAMGFGKRLSSTVVGPIVIERWDMRDEEAVRHIKGALEFASTGGSADHINVEVVNV